LLKPTRSHAGTRGALRDREPGAPQRRRPQRAQRLGRRRARHHAHRGHLAHPQDAPGLKTVRYVLGVCFVVRCVSL